MEGTSGNESEGSTSGYGDFGGDYGGGASPMSRDALRASEIAYGNLMGLTNREQNPGFYGWVDNFSRAPGAIGLTARGVGLTGGMRNELGNYMDAGGVSYGGSGGLNGDYREGDSGYFGMTGGASDAAGTAATDPLADIFAEFTGSAGDITYNAPTYNADPSGLLTKGGNYADTYERQFAPYARKLMDQVDLYGSDKFREQQRSQAMAGLQQQGDAGYGAAQRNMMRQGVNPASGRMAAMANQNAIQTAAAKTQAAMNSDASLRDTYNKGLTAVNQLGVDVSKLGQGWAALGNDAAKTQNTWGLANSEFGLRAATQNQNNAYNWGNLATQRYGIDKGVERQAMSDDAASDRQTDSNLWSLGGLALNGLFG